MSEIAPDASENISAVDYPALLNQIGRRGRAKATSSIHLGCRQNPRISLRPASRRSRSSDSAPPNVLTALRKPGAMRLRRMRMLVVAIHYPHVLFTQPPHARHRTTTGA